MIEADFTVRINQQKYYIIITLNITLNNANHEETRTYVIPGTTVNQ